MRIRTLVFATVAALAAAGSPDSYSAALGSGITYQGTFADNGAPADGIYDFEFALFTAAAGGSAVQTVTKADLLVSGGLVNTLVDFGFSAYSGDARWIEVHVRPGASSGSYTVLSPRQALTAAPFALGLPMPFVRDVSTGASVNAFKINALNDTIAIEGDIPAGSTHAAIYGVAPDGAGVDGVSVTSYGVLGQSTSGTGIYGHTASAAGIGMNAENDVGTAVRGKSFGAGDGVRGVSNAGTGVSGFGASYGVHGVGSTGVWSEGSLLATGSNSCNTSGLCASIFNVVNATIGNLIIASSGTPSTDVFRVNGNGSVFANGDYNVGGADIAEYVPASAKLEPGDVVEIDSDNGAAFRLSSHSNSTAVGGVISTRPGVSLNNSTAEESAAKGMPRLALSGRVPVKVTSENGAIRAGDLLVSSSKPGHAMRAPPSPQAGTVIGKAMQKLDTESGEIEMLVMLR